MEHRLQLLSATSPPQPAQALRRSLPTASHHRWENEAAVHQPEHVKRPRTFKLQQGRQSGRPEYPLLHLRRFHPQRFPVCAPSGEHYRQK